MLDVFQSNYTVACFSGGVETTDPDLMWYTGLYSTSGTNFSKYANPEMDAALDAGRTTADEAARAEAYATVQQLLATESPIIQYAGVAPWGWVVRRRRGRAAGAAERVVHAGPRVPGGLSERQRAASRTSERQRAGRRWGVGAQPHDVEG